MNIWWKIRHVWHLPSMLKECVKPEVYWIDTWKYSLGVRDYFEHLIFIYRRKVRIIKDVKNTIRIFFWWVSYTQPFHCNGNCGGWRTTLCDWLEDKARENEDRV